MEKINSNSNFSQILLDYVPVANGFVMEKRKYETYKQDTLSMSNAILSDDILSD